MNYKRIHDNIIENALSRPKQRNVRYERHHIIPKCLGGDNSKDNLVKLYPREHYIIHQLLVKIFPDNYKLICAARYMTVHNTENRSKNKEYEWLRNKFSANHPCKNPEIKNKISNSLKSYFQSDEYRLKMGDNYKPKRMELNICPYCDKKYDRDTMFCSRSCGARFRGERIRGKKWTNLDAKKQLSTSLKTYVNSLSKEQKLSRIKKAQDSPIRGKRISEGKKGKSTNQAYISGERYSKMSDQEFENFLLTKKSSGRNRMITLRNNFIDGKVHKKE